MNVKKASEPQGKYSDFFHHVAIEFSLFLQCQRIGTAAAGHAVETKGASVVCKRCVCAHFGFVYVELCAQNVGGFLSGGNKGSAQREFFQQGRNVSGLHHFQKFVGSIALQTAHSGSGIIERYAVFGAEAFNFGLSKSAFGSVDKVIVISEKQVSHDAPHVVLQIGIKEVHAPSFLRWRKTAQHQDVGFGGQKRQEGVLLDVGGGVHISVDWEQSSVGRSYFFRYCFFRLKLKPAYTLK